MGERDYGFRMEIDTRFPTKLEAVFEAPKPFRRLLVDNLSSEESIALLVHAPAFSTAEISSRATVLAVTSNRWLVASENEDGGVSLEKADFDETLFVELSSVLISGQLTIHFATVGTSYRATMKFDTVEAKLAESVKHWKTAKRYGTPEPVQPDAALFLEKG